MAVLLAKHNGVTTRYELKEGINRLGRNPANDVVIGDPSLSGQHCEITVRGSQVLVKDLGSTNGTYIDLQKINQGSFRSGQVLRLGTVELTLDSNNDVSQASPAQTIPPPPIPPPVPATNPCARHPVVEAVAACPKCGQIFCSQCLVDGKKFGLNGALFCPSCSTKCDPLAGGQAKSGNSTAAAIKRSLNSAASFPALLMGAFAYPFKRNGIFLMVGGTIFFTIADFVTGFLWLIGLLTWILSSGYFVAYMQSIATSSADGDEDMPNWPDVSNLYEDAIVPFFQMVGTCFSCMTPALLVNRWMKRADYPMLGEEGTLVVVALLALAGLFMLPMAVLSVAMHDTVKAALLAVPAIFKVPWHYCIVVFALVISLAIVVGLQMLLDMMNLPILPALLSSFIGLYSGCVVMRMLGLLYFTNKQKIAWF